MREQQQLAPSSQKMNWTLHPVTSTLCEWRGALIVPTVKYLVQQYQIDTGGPKLLWVVLVSESALTWRSTMPFPHVIRHQPTPRIPRFEVCELAENSYKNNRVTTKQRTRPSTSSSNTLLVPSQPIIGISFIRTGLKSHHAFVTCSFWCGKFHFSHQIWIMATSRRFSSCYSPL